MTMLGKCHEYVNDCNLALGYGIDKSVLCKWKKQTKKICDAACAKNCKLLTRNRPSKIQEKVYKEFSSKV